MTPKNEKRLRATVMFTAGLGLGWLTSTLLALLIGLVNR